MHRLSQRTVPFLAVALVLLATPLPARAEEPKPESSTSYLALVGVGSVICSVIYAPLKLAYATGGLVISGLAWVWTGGDTYVSKPIYRSAVGGDYVLTPDQIDGQRSVSFAGSPTG